MAVHDDVLRVPTMEHAQAAAEVLAGEGASSVLLFGSVAAGDARPGSDIDLVAVFDDIDYEARHPLKWRLDTRCAETTGVPVEVHVTDWPEWKMRTQQVPSSFEAAVSAHSITLHERDPQPGAVDWGKEQVMPDSEMQEAMSRIAGVKRALSSMASSCRQHEGETAEVDGRVEIIEHVREDRLRDLCADAAMAVENSLKAWAALNGVESERGTHRINRLIGASRPLPPEIEEALEPLRRNTLHPSKAEWDDITCWRIGTSYPSDMPRADPERSGRIANLLTRAAVTIADSTMERLVEAGADPADNRIVQCRERLSTARATLASCDPVVGIPQTAPAAVTPEPSKRRRWWGSR